MVIVAFPRDISVRCIYLHEDEITLVDDEYGKTYECEVRRAERNPTEMWIGHRWYGFVKDKGFGSGDVLCFTIQNPPEVVHMTLKNR